MVPSDLGISSDGSTADGPGNMIDGLVFGCKYSSVSAIVLGTSTLEAPAAAAAAAAAIATGASDGRRINLSPGIIRYRPGSRAFSANVSASCLKVGRASASSTQQESSMQYTSSEQMSGCGSLWPISISSGTSFAGTFS
uniref:Uncharacterized protein n=1 Tax=Anopheles merus TaxID=30066 RepID=A0A182UUG5_ANOME